MLYLVKWSHVKHSVNVSFEAVLHRPPLSTTFLWINNRLDSYNIDCDKLSTDFWDNKALLWLLCGPRVICEAFVMYGVAKA